VEKETGKIWKAGNLHAIIKVTLPTGNRETAGGKCGMVTRSQNAILALTRLSWISQSDHDTESSSAHAIQRKSLLE
jgi:hypothetical protein